MSCLECNRLFALLTAAINKNADLRAKDLAATVNKAIEHELAASEAKITSLRRQLLDHKATHELTLILSKQILALLGEAHVTRSTALEALRAAQSAYEDSEESAETE